MDCKLFTLIKIVRMKPFSLCENFKTAFSAIFLVLLTGRNRAAYVSIIVLNTNSAQRAAKPYICVYMCTPCFMHILN